MVISVEGLGAADAGWSRTEFCSGRLGGIKGIGHSTVEAGGGRGRGMAPDDAGSVTAVSRRLITPRWLGALALALLYAILAYQLGHWQYGRHEFKVERNALLDAHYRADPVPVTDVLSDRPVERSREDWTKVTATGTYAGQQRRLADRLFETAADDIAGVTGEHDVTLRSR